MKQKRNNPCLTKTPLRFTPHLQHVTRWAVCLIGSTISCHCAESYDRNRARRFLRLRDKHSPLSKRSQYYCPHISGRICLSSANFNSHSSRRYVCMQCLNDTLIPPDPHPHSSTTSEQLPVRETYRLSDIRNARPILTLVKELSAHATPTTSHHPAESIIGR